MKNWLLIFLLALLVRISYLILVPQRPLHFDDTISWDSVAWNLLNGRGFTEIDGKPTSVRPPIYPIFLAIMYALFGRNYYIVHLTQAVIGAISCVLVFLLAKKFFNERTSFFIGLCCSLWPASIVYTGIIGSEILFTFFLLLFLILLYNEKQTFLPGVILGITNLIRSTIVAYPIFVVIFLLLSKADFKNIKRIITIFVISLIVVSSWTIRNYVVFRRFLLINTSAGELFFSGTYIPWDGICKHGRDENFYKLFNLENPVDNERKMFIYGLKNIKENPFGFLKLSIKKFFRFWFKPVGQELVSKKYPLLGILIFLPHGLLVILCWIFLLRYYRKKFFYILVLFIYFTIMHNLLSPIPRYRLPIEPLLIMFATPLVLKFIKYE